MARAYIKLKGYSDVATASEISFNLTPDVDRVAVLPLDNEGSIFRVAVLGGGCAFQYEFSIDNAVNDDDQILN